MRSTKEQSALSAVLKTATSGMASRVIWNLCLQIWEAHHLETTCFRCTNFSKNTQNSQCQYLLPNLWSSYFQTIHLFLFPCWVWHNAKPMVSCNIIPGISHAWSYDFLQSEEIPTVFAKTSPRTGSARKNCYS